MKPVQAIKKDIFKTLDHINEEANSLPESEEFYSRFASSVREIKVSVRYVRNLYDELWSIITPVNKMDLNKADKLDFIKIKNLSPTIAEEINNNHFESFGEIQKKITGVGQKKIFRLAEQFTFKAQIEQKEEIEGKISDYKEEFLNKLTEIENISKTQPVKEKIRKSDFYNEKNLIKNGIGNLTKELKILLEDLIKETNFLSC